MANAVIVGAGPAGIAAAGVLVGAGVEVTLVDEASRPGGQIDRRPSPDLALDMSRVLGRGHAAYQRFHADVAALLGRMEYRPETLAWNVHGGALHVATRAGMDALPYDALVLATGATDRVMSVAGGTLPGVFTLGAAQALLKDQGCLIGRRIVFMGSSPLLYLAALQVLRMGGRVAAVLDTNAFAAKVRAVPEMLAAPGTLSQGIRYMAALRRAGVPIMHGVRVMAIEGDGRVAGVAWRRGSGAVQRIGCDAVAYGHGLRPETQLAELAGCGLRFDAERRLHMPVTDIDGRAGRAVYVAGDGGTIGGADAASVSGTLAGAAVMRDLGVAGTMPDVAALRRTLVRLRRFQRGLAGAFAWPWRDAAGLDDAVAVCRCENVTAGEIRAALRGPGGALEVNRMKAVTRCGMGRCQGRFCGNAAAELTAAVLGRQDGELDRLRAQPPVKPLPIMAAEGTPL